MIKQIPKLDDFHHPRPNLKSAGLRWKVFLLEVEHDQYDWRKGAQYAGRQGAEPWDALTTIAPGLQYYHVMESGWSLWAKFEAIAATARTQVTTATSQLNKIKLFNDGFRVIRV
jgi:hypothetical protein